VSFFYKLNVHHLKWFILNFTYNLQKRNPLTVNKLFIITDEDTTPEDRTLYYASRRFSYVFGALGVIRSEPILMKRSNIKVCNCVIVSCIKFTDFFYSYQKNEWIPDYEDYLWQLLIQLHQRYLFQNNIKEGVIVYQIFCRIKQLPLRKFEIR
jgi:hypothetical protein